MKLYVFNVDQPMARGVFDRGAGYCGVTACVLEGLNHLGVDVTAACEGLHVRRTGPFRNDYDLYLVQRSLQYDHAAVFRTLERNRCLERTAFIDGFDYTFGPDRFWLESPATYFLKENFGEFAAETLLFGIEDRFIPPQRDTTPPGRVMLAFRYDTHPDRAAIRTALCEAGLDVVCDTIEDPPERRTALHWQTGRRHNQTYYQALAHCRVGVSVEGEAVDTLRYWEFAAGRAVLVAPPVERIITGFPDPPMPGRHYIPYHSIDEVVDAVRRAVEQYNDILPVQRAFFLSRHRSIHRARRLLAKMGHATPHGDTRLCV